jgi:uncharacterized protein
MAATQSDNAQLVQLLLDHGANISAIDNDGRNALFMAAYTGHVSMLKLLVQCGLSITSVDSIDITPLMAAAAGNHTLAAEWLLQQGIAVDAVNNAGITALHVACESDSCDDTAMIELLLANGADVNKRSEHGQTALYEAAMNGHVDCVKVLIAAGADVNSANSSGKTSLHVAVVRDRSAVVQLLLEHGATAVMNDVVPLKCPYAFVCDCKGLTALMISNIVGTAKLLLAAGADVHVTTDAGDTCLHKALRHRLQIPVLCLLIKAGVDLHAVNNEGKTAAQIAHDKSYTLIEQLLNRTAQQGY